MKKKNKVKDSKTNLSQFQRKDSNWNVHKSINDFIEKTRNIGRTPILPAHKAKHSFKQALKNSHEAFQSMASFSNNELKRAQRKRQSDEEEEKVKILNWVKWGRVMGVLCSTYDFALEYP